jgi:endoglucanase
MVWMACSTAGRPLVARWWPLVRGTANAAPLSRNVDGSPRQRDVAALSAVAAASAAQAAGDHTAAHQLLTRASEIDAKYPSYYGAAWVALGRMLLTTDRLAHC